MPSLEFVATLNRTKSVKAKLDTKIDQPNNLCYNKYEVIRLGKVSGIYKIINKIDGKIYVGQTQNYHKRKQKHLAALRANSHFNTHLQRAFNKYGEKAFEISLLCECEIEELDRLEVEWISALRCADREYGYNLMYGGQVFRSFTPEIRMRMSMVNRGKKFSKEHRRHISESQKGRIISQCSIDKMKATKMKNNSHQGQKNPNAVISDDAANEIIQRLYEKREPVKTICSEYGVTQDTVYNLIYGKTYRHILPEIRKELSSWGKDNVQDRIAQGIEMYLQGESQNKISKELNISRNTLRKELQARGLNTKCHVNQYIKQANTEVSNQITKG